ncbi:hypothetical protein T12_1224 [Trichinella patagoniensis]|uniref:Uncharacterized protein n=1 Tax=Trichinella patagoniensis TaxID=990121 RepID=A0A0V0YSE7_9BILA|nr:hypothetical protein T12_1224 [Trichinella patagoniensis]
MSQSPTSIPCYVSYAVRQQSRLATFYKCFCCPQRGNKRNSRHQRTAVTAPHSSLFSSESHLD